MNDRYFRADWRPRSMRMRRFYAKYLRWLVIGGYVFTLLGLAGIVAAFIIRVDQTVATPQPAELTLDGGRVLAKGTVQGETVSAATVGAHVVVSQIAAQSEGGGLVRLALPDGRTMTSRRLLPPGSAESVGRVLAGQDVRVPKDRPLRIEGVESLEIEATAGTAPGAGRPFAMDPPRDLGLPGRVTEGKHLAKVQLADLPRPAQAAVEQALRAALAGKRLVGPAGPAVDVPDLHDVRAIVQVRVGEGHDTPDALEGQTLERSFACTVEIVDPPKWLVDLIRETQAAGQKVTARLEVTTGTVPAALKLLKR
jgi:hypothetical protein